MGVDDDYDDGGDCRSDSHRRRRFVADCDWILVGRRVALALDNTLVVA